MSVSFDTHSFFESLSGDAARFFGSIAVGSAAAYVVGSFWLSITQFAVVGAVILSPVLWIATLISFIGTWIAIIKAISTLIAVTGWTSENWGSITDATERACDVIGDACAGAGDVIGGVVGGARNWVSRLRG